MWRVLLHNDDYTTQEFVVYVLMKYFQHDATTAQKIMLHVHTKGIGEVGVCGAGAAIANAVFNATGVRVRDMPITLDKLLPHLPPV